MSSAMLSPAVTIRRATPADAAVAGRHCYEGFAAINAKHGYGPEIPSVEVATGLVTMLTSHPGFYGVVAEVSGELVGSNFLDERSVIAGVGPITVSVAEQNHGVGRALMQAVLDRARDKGFAGVRLVQSAFHARSLSLYTKLGFAVREPLVVMQGFPEQKKVEGYTVRTATSEDIAACNRVCVQVHGHVREGELRGALLQGQAIVVERAGQVVGYSAGFGYMGHSVAESTPALQALLGNAKEYSGPGVLVPTRNEALFRWTLEQGMRVVSPCSLMTMGLYNEPTGAYLPSILY